MHAMLHALPLALSCAASAALRAAEMEPLPPIFAPKSMAAPTTPSRAVERSVPPTALRQAMTETILAAAKVVSSAPTTSETARTTPATVAPDGTLLMPRFVVKSVAPPADEVERRSPVLQLGRFTPMERVDRRRNALSMPIMSLGDGRSLELNVVNGAGYGLDHNVDFTRVELGVRIRF